MSDFQNDMNRAVQGFVTQITDLARRAALDTLEAAFTGNGQNGTAPGTMEEQPRGDRGAKRSPADLEALSERFGTFVKANPGLRIEQINKQLGTTTKDLALPIRKLLSEGMISTKGQKRSTTYFVGKKAKN